MKIKEKVEKINSIISQESWMDMEVLSVKGGNLVIGGSIDFTYGHSLEIIFEDIFYLSINMEWKVDTSKPTLFVADREEAMEVNKAFRVEQGNLIFKLKAEDVEEFFYVAAKNLDFNTDRVLYYFKDNLGENERIADWVKINPQ